MPVYVRKNIITFSLTFKASDGSTIQPSAANAVLTYKDQGGVGREDTVALVYSSATNLWTGTWDTSAAGEGTVCWMAYGYGTLQAATQGSFEVSANSANTV